MLIDRIKSGAKHIAGLDIGTSKVCVVVGEVRKDGVSIIAGNSVTSSGVKKGVIEDIDAAANSVRKAVSGAEKLIGRPISDVFASISGTHIKSFVNTGSSVIVGGAVTEEDIEEALEAAADVDIQQNHEMIQIIPADFIIDGESGIMNPLGMSGSMLEAKVLIFTSNINPLENLIKCCEAAEITVKDIVLQPIASSEASLTSRQRGNGCAVIDIGGGITEIAIYKYNWLRHAAILGVGGNHFTNDLSIVLEIPFHEAERVKINNGFIISEAADERNEIFETVFDCNKKNLSQKDISAILLARSEELLQLIKKEIDHTTDLDGAISEAVLTGGACLLPGFRQLAEDILSIPVRIAYPEMISKNYGKIDISKQPAILHNVSSEFNQPVYAAGIGLVMYGAEELLAREKIITNHHFSVSTISKLAGWFKNIR
jgi:cell division protein FtsA